MCRKLRYFPPGTLVEVTTRTLQSRFLLPPTRQFARTVVGILARAQERAPIRIHAVAGLSGHMHILATVDDAEQLADFMEYANGNIAREALRIVAGSGWSGKVWGRRYAAIPVSDEEPAQVKRLRYLLSHGAKENLVTSPRLWPGLHCIDALIDGKPLEGIWYDRSAEYEADRRDKDVDPRAFIAHYSLELEPLPCWRHLPGEEYRQRITEMVHNIEVETARRIFLTGKVPPGPEAIRQQHPHQQAVRPKKSPAPFCHAFSKEAGKQLREAYRLFVEAYRQAAAQLRSGNRSARFPEGCFPPALPFARNDAGLPSSRQRRQVDALPRVDFVKKSDLAHACRKDTRAGA
ncbi:MAG: transposase [Thermoanaerobaculia bacterium]